MSKHLETQPPTLRMNFVLLPRFNMMTFMGLLEPTRIANYLSPRTLFVHEIYSFDGSEIFASNGIPVKCSEPLKDLDRNDIIFVIGSWGGEHYENSRLISWLRRQARMGARLCAVELGAYIFARAGLLSGKDVTTHWSYLAGLKEKFPDVVPKEQLYTNNGKIMTCAGGVASIDLMLSLIDERLGPEIAAEVTDQMMFHSGRKMDAPQRVSLGGNINKHMPNVQSAINIIEARISEPLTVPELARKICISQRQLERQFKKDLGCSVVQFGLSLRLQHARDLLISTAMSIREISTASGFNSLSHFAFAFRSQFGRRASEYRVAWPETEKSPYWPGTIADHPRT